MHKLVILLLIITAMPAFANKLIITETGKYSSLDPLDGDSTENILVSRMLYATPLHPKNGHELESQILETFSFNKNKNCLEFKIKENLKFSNEQPITIHDLEMSILRMAHKRPDFPIISEIKGIKEWNKKKYPLENKLEGVNIKGRTLTIHFKQKVEHALFRLSLELFGIIPRSSVDTKTGKTKGTIPTSGPYIIKKETKNSIYFEISDQFKDQNYPEKITFEYQNIKNITNNEIAINNGDVVYANELLMDSDDIDAIRRSFYTKKLPTTRFAALSISSKSKIINTAKKRRWFRDQFKKTIEKEFKNTFKYEPSIFTELLPGYQKSNETPFKITESYKNEPEITTIKLGKLGKNENKILTGILEKMAINLKVKEVKIIEYSDKQKLITDFNAGNIDLYSSSSGFWPVSPVQDLKMLFTPGLHGLLKHQHHDKTLQTLIKKLTESPTKQNYGKINQHLYKDATFNVYRHVSRLYFGLNKNQINHIPVGYLTANPWHIFIKN